MNIKLKKQKSGERKTIENKVTKNRLEKKKFFQIFSKQVLAIGFSLALTIVLVGCDNNQEQANEEGINQGGNTEIVVDGSVVEGQLADTFIGNSLMKQATAQFNKVAAAIKDDLVAGKQEGELAESKPKEEDALAKPDKPTQPTKPAKPTKPSETKPEKPNVPVKPSEPTISAADLLDKATAGVEAISGMEAISGERIEELFGLDTSKLESHSVRINLVNIKATEIGVFKVKDSKYVSQVKAGIKQHVENKIAGWMPGYMPDEITNMENYSVKSNGKYVIYIIADEEDKAKILEAFAGALK